MYDGHAVLGYTVVGAKASQAIQRSDSRYHAGRTRHPNRAYNETRRHVHQPPHMVRAQFIWVAVVACLIGGDGSSSEPLGLVPSRHVAAQAALGAGQSGPTRAKIDVSKLGPQVGERVPDFSLKDQNGRVQTLQSIMGAKGAMLVFIRSADW
jgi:hypothetical protein